MQAAGRTKWPRPVPRLLLEKHYRALSQAARAGTKSQSQLSFPLLMAEIALDTGAAGDCGDLEGSRPGVGGVLMSRKIVVGDWRFSAL